MARVNSRAAEPEYVVPMIPSEFTKGGGVAPGRHSITGAKWVDDFNYQGAIKENQLALAVEFDGDQTENYTAGKESTASFSPTADGGSLTWSAAELKKPEESRRRTIASTGKAGLFLMSLANAGHPEDKLDDISEIVGLDVEIEHVAQPKRSGIVNAKGEDPKPVALVVEIYEAEEKPEKSSAKGKPNGKAVAAKEPEKEEGDEEDELREMAAKYVQRALESKGKLKKGSELNGVVFKLLPGDAPKSRIVNILFEEEFLKSGPWTYNKGVLSAD